MKPTVFFTRFFTRAIFTWAIFLCLGLLLAAPLEALERAVPRDHHPWGKFQVGAWKKVRSVKETLDEKGKILGVSITETTTTLTKVDDDGFELRIDVKIEVAGRVFNPDTTFIRQGFSGEMAGQSFQVRKIKQENLLIDGVSVPCEIRMIEIKGKDTNKISTVYYAKSKSPYVLKRDVQATDAKKEKKQYETRVSVVALDMPHKVLADIKNTAHVKTFHKHGAGSTITLEVYCADIPGGVVSHTSKELGESDRLVRRSMLELVDYGFESDEQMTRRRVFRRKNRRK